jgi:hypothetical protein
MDAKKRLMKNCGVSEWDGVVIKFSAKRVAELMEEYSQSQAQERYDKAVKYLNNSKCKDVTYDKLGCINIALELASGLKL